MDKLQELTDKLYNEGLSKGKQEGEAIVSQAKQQAEQILAQAKQQAEQILAQAKKQAEDFKGKTETDVKMSSAKALQATKGDIENLVVTKLVNTEVSKALSAPDFLKGIITEVAKKFSTQESSDLEVILPESLKSELEPFVKNELGKMLSNGIQAKFSKKLAGGFNIGPKDGGYFVSLSDDTFKDLISEYIRPATKKLLFGQ